MVDVDGEPVTVTFGSTKRQIRVAGGAAALGVLVAAAAGLLTLGAATALGARAEAEARLAAAEQLAAARLRAGEGLQRQRAAARALTSAAADTGRIDDVLADLSWATASKTPDARIVALHWDRGVMAVEVRGETAPFTPTSKAVERAAKPLRPGVWLWGVNMRPDAPRAAR